jgi:hypothetical protein
MVEAHPVALDTEARLWTHIHPRLRGRQWRRIEPKGYDPGFADAFGFYGSTTQWVELKVGKPGINKLRPSQIGFCEDARADGIGVWCCFAHNGVVKWCIYPDFAEVLVPKFYDETRVVRPLRRHP